MKYLKYVIAIMLFSMSASAQIQLPPTGNAKSINTFLGWMQVDSGLVPPYKMTVSYKRMGQLFFDLTDSSYKYWVGNAIISIPKTGGGSGTVNTIAIASANGIAGSSSGGANPILTLSVTPTGLLKSNGSAVSAAIAGTDYLTPSGAAGIYVPYSGATANLALGSYSVTATNFSGNSSGVNTGDQVITLTGDCNGTGTGSFSTALTSVVVAGSCSYCSVTYDAKGRVTGTSSGSAPTGTVTSVSVVSINGISGAVATATTTPAISVSLDTIQSSTELKGVLHAIATPDPATPAPNTGFIYMDSTHHVLNIKNDAGVVSNTAIPNAGGTGLYLKSFAADGTFATGSLAAFTTQTVVATSYTTSVTVTSNLASEESKVHYTITAQNGALLFAAPSGSWAHGQQLEIDIYNNGVIGALTYNAGFAGTTKPTATVVGEWTKLLFVYNAYATNKFQYMGTKQTGN